MREVETIVGLLAVIVVLGGLALGFVPGLPHVSMPPDLALLVFLPPLLCSESLTLSWRDFRANLRPISLLAIGLVAMTTVLVAVTAHAVIPGLPWAAAFPQRDMLIFLTFAVILSPLVVQGLSLPALIARLNLKEDAGIEREETDARLRASQAGLARLNAIAKAETLPEEIVADLREHITNKTQRFGARTQGEANDDYETRAATYRRLRHEVLDAERKTVVGLRDQSAISDGVMQRLQRTLDLEEQRLATEEDDFEL